MGGGTKKWHEFDLYRTILCRYFAGYCSMVLFISVEVGQIFVRPQSGLCTYEETEANGTALGLASMRWTEEKKIAP